MRVDDEVVEGEARQIPTRVYRPATERTGALPGLVWAHGGAFVGGDLDMPESDAVARALAATGRVVIAVDYRLAGQFDVVAGTIAPAGTGHPYPAGLDDVVAVFSAVRSAPARFGVDPFRLSLGGASAGANLASATVLRLRDAGAPGPVCAVLAYPAVHAVEPPVRPELAPLLDGLPPEDRFPAPVLELIGLNYLGGRAELAAEAYAYPGGHDLSGFAPTLVLNSEADDLRPSGEAFAAELAAHGIEVWALAEPGTRHGHLNRPDEPSWARSIERIDAWLRAHERESSAS